MANVFKGGVPYAVDVNRIKEEIPTQSLTEGTVIEHARLSALVGARAGDQRYYGVVNAWRSQMKNAHGIFIVWEPTQGVKVLAPSDILTYAEMQTRQKIKQTGRAIRHFAWVDRNRLDATGQKRLDHQTRVASAIKDALTTARREMAVNISPVKSLPRRAISA